MAGDVVIGVDAGGTHAVAVVVDGAGRELARARAPGAVAVRRAIGPAVDAVAAAAADALGSASLASPVEALWAGVAGAGREDVRAAVEAALATRGLARRVRVGTDVEAALESAFGDGPGILLIAGTGSIAMARAADGRIERAGGWGVQLGDEGSAYWIASQAVGAVARAEDGRGQRTVLRAALIERLAMDDPRELVPWVEVATKGEMAALAPAVLDVARAGDAVAASIATDAAAALRSHVVALLERLGDTEDLAASRPLAIALSGGLIREGGPLRAVLERLLEPVGLPIHGGPLDPPLGAARLAARLEGQIDTPRPPPAPK